MVELYINNQICAINDIKIELNITNPFLSDKNSHTLDITLPLTNENNARVFKFLNRFDRPIKNSESYYGVIRNDGVIIFEGDVSLLEVNNESVKIQIVKKENFFRFRDENDTQLIGGYRIDRLGLGAIPIEDARFLSTVTQYNDYYLTPLYEEEPQIPMVNKANTYQSAQPLLIKTMEAVLEYLGFKVEYNFLRSHQFYKSLIIITDFIGNNWSKCLPAWTVAKFVIEFEKLFNCEILFDVENNRSIIRSKKIYLESLIQIDAFDDYKVETQDVGKGLNLYSNVAYNFPDDLYYKEADLTDEQNEAIKLREIEMATIPENSPIRGAERFRYKGSSGTVYDGEFCRYDNNNQGYKNGTLRPVNNYRHLGFMDADNLIKLNIIPCKHTCVYPRKFGDNLTVLVSRYLTLPVSIEYEHPEPTVQNDSFTIIYDGLSPMPNKNDSVMIVAIEGLKSEGFQAMNLNFAINNAYNSTDYLWSQQISSSINLTLSYLRKEFWINDMIDTTNKYKVNAFFPLKDKIDNLKVNIKNKIFIIESVKFTIDKTGLDPIAELELYPLKEQS